ncbi:hypothetical protein [Mycobacterium intracellulare]|nr:hypothetical protein [Mycobacterium intracellulare]
MRAEPSPEDVDTAHDPASEIPIWDPDDTLSTLEFTGVPPDGEPNDCMSDEPAVIFEVPPSVTDVDILRVLGQERIATLQKLTQIRGVDALGWYVTFHQRKFQIGIHIPVEGILWLVANVLQAVDADVGRKIELAFHAILRHELFHFAADCMTANWELGRVSRFTGLPAFTETKPGISSSRKALRMPICFGASGTPRGCWQAPQACTQP